MVYEVAFFADGKVQSREVEASSYYRTRATYRFFDGSIDPKFEIETERVIYVRAQREDTE